MNFNPASDTIVGIVSAQGLVVSEPVAGAITKPHSEIFPPARCRWRWSGDKGIYTFTDETGPTADEKDAIECHLYKKYGIGSILKTFPRREAVHRLTKNINP